MTIIVSHGNVLLLLILTLPAFADASDQGEAAQADKCKRPFLKDTVDNGYVVRGTNCTLYCNENEVFVEELQQCIKNSSCTPNKIYLLESEDDCTKTHLCYMGKFLRNRNCPPNQAYDKSIKKCSTEAYEQCITSTLTMPTSRMTTIHGETEEQTFIPSTSEISSSQSESITTISGSTAATEEHTSVPSTSEISSSQPESITTLSGSTAATEEHTSVPSTSEISSSQSESITTISGYTAATEEATPVPSTSEISSSQPESSTRISGSTAATEEATPVPSTPEISSSQPESTTTLSGSTAATEEATPVPSTPEISSSQPESTTRISVSTAATEDPTSAQPEISNTQFTSTASTFFSSPSEISTNESTTRTTASAETTLGPCTGAMSRPNPKNCSKYFQCVAGEEMEYTCPIGSLFSKEYLICYPAFLTRCEEEVATTFPPPTSTTALKAKCTGAVIRPDPTNCSKYFQCVAGEEMEYTCPMGSLFSKEYLICYPDFLTRCEEEVATTFPPPTRTTALKVRCSDPTPKPMSKDCSKYLQCIAGELEEITCPPGTLFHPEYKVCYPSFLVNCNKRRRRKRMVKALRPKNMICPEELPAKVADPRDASTYFFCSSNRKVIRIHCGTCRVFDPHSKKCRDI